MPTYRTMTIHTQGHVVFSSLCSTNADLLCLPEIQEALDGVEPAEFLTLDTDGLQCRTLWLEMEAGHGSLGSEHVPIYAAFTPAVAKTIARGLVEGCIDIRIQAVEVDFVEIWTITPGSAYLQRL